VEHKGWEGGRGKKGEGKVISGKISRTWYYSIMQLFCDTPNIIISVKIDALYGKQFFM
jgi:hypothetical protein